MNRVSEPDEKKLSEVACPCGFLARSSDEDRNFEVFARHECAGTGKEWHESLFSFEGVMVVGALAFCLIIVSAVIVSGGLG